MRWPGPASKTEAAYQLHLTPSSISVQLKKLEQELGVRLFNPRLILPRDHSLYAKKKISLDDLHDCRFVFLPKSTTSRHLIEDRFYRSGS
ncbi:MAG: LysR family transcriptional regulator [Candidatus Binatia bacterium]